ncbi:RNA polymerase sigma factor [Deminuibacter soli]|uniref:RNA polymerase subunit sigma-70 n=1 Tax=Deminuibacter soli TaxID=2291815 RepID=A0A3E1NPM7_9BACT|nr:sigma-70 family RNA polymerase sigma factor [Deminuibacter soli]RFM29882.1 RNA polymerase subunit sigma-70 [Deminuibacter soli]
MPEIKTYSEAELIPLLKQREQSAFGYLYDHYSGALNTVVLSIIPDKTLCGDVLQEVFIKIWRQIDSYDESKGRLFTWMLNITRNAAIDMVRSKGYQNTKQNQELTESVYDAGGSALPNVDKIGLRKVVHTLREEYRVLVDLSYFQGFTQEEIAKMLDIPLGTVKTRLRAALIQLRQLVKP